MKTLKLQKSLYRKSTILFFINLNLDGVKYDIREDEANYYLDFERISEARLDEFRKKINFHELRMSIAHDNKEIRASIITKALGTANYE